MNTARAYCGNVTSPITTSDDRNTGVRMRRNSSNGSGDRSAWRVNVASSATATSETGDRGRVTPTPVSALREAEDEQRQAGSAQHQADDVEPALRPARRVHEQRRPAMAPMMPIGTLGRNNQCQLTAVTR